MTGETAFCLGLAVTNQWLYSLTTKPSCKPSIRGEIPSSSTLPTVQSVNKSPKGPRNQVSKGMPSSSPTKTSTSSLSLDSVHSGQSSPSIDSNHSQQTHNAAKPRRSGGFETQSQIPVYTPTRDQPSSLRFPPEQRASQSPPVVNLRQNPHQQLNTSPSSLSMLPTGFASLHVGIGSPKFEFGRDWPGTGRRQRESSLGPEAVENGRLMRERAAQEQRRMEESSSGRENGERGGYVNKVSGLPSPPGTESDIAPPVEANHSLSRNGDNASARYGQVRLMFLLQLVTSRPLLTSPHSLAIANISAPAIRVSVTPIKTRPSILFLSPSFTSYLFILWLIYQPYPGIHCPAVPRPSKSLPTQEFGRLNVNVPI